MRTSITPRPLDRRIYVIQRRAARNAATGSAQPIAFDLILSLPWYHHRRRANGLSADQESTALHKLPSIFHPSDKTDISLSARNDEIALRCTPISKTSTQFAICNHTIQTHRLRSVSIASITSPKESKRAPHVAHPGNRQSVGVQANTGACCQLSGRYRLSIAYTLSYVAAIQGDKALVVGDIDCWRIRG